jgi:hypothetical protein
MVEGKISRFNNFMKLGGDNFNYSPPEMEYSELSRRFPKCILLVKLRLHNCALLGYGNLNMFLQQPKHVFMAANQRATTEDCWMW